MSIAPPPGARPPFPAAAARALEASGPAPPAVPPTVEVRLPADLMAQLRHAFAVSDGGNTRAAVLGDALPRQVAFRNPKRVALGIFPVTSGAAVFWGFSDAVRPADNDGLMPGIPVPSTGLWVYGWQYLGPVWIVGAGNSSWPLDVRIVEHSACDPKILTGG